MGEKTLRILRGTLRSSKHERCIEEIAAAHESDGNIKCIMLVPEHYSFETERELVHRFGIIGLNGINVMTPRKMAVNILNTTVSKYLRPAGKQMLVAKAVRRYCDSHEETRLTSAMRMRGFADSMASLISEMKRYRIDAEALMKAGAAASSERLREKTDAAAKIYMEYERLLFEGNFTDSDDDINRLADAIYSNKDINKNTMIWIDSFDEFSPAQLRLIDALVMSCGRVTVCLNCPDVSGIEDDEERNSIYASYAPVMTALRRFREMFKTEEICFDDLTSEQTTPEISHLMRFFESTREFPDKAENIKIYECRDPHSEAEYIASEILALVRGGMRFRDIGVLFGGAVDYEYIINSVFAEHDIPFFADEKIVLSDHPIAMQILSVFDIIENDWNYESVFNYLHAGYIYVRENGKTVHISSDDVAVLENYVNRYGVRGRSKWLGKLNDKGEFTPEPWRMEKEVFEAVWDEDEPKEEESEELERVNAVRMTVIKPFLKLASALRGKKHTDASDAAFYARILTEFLEEIGLYEGLREDIKKLESYEPDIENPHTAARRLAQIWTEILDVANQVVVTAADEEMSFKEFGDSIAAGLSKCEIRIIPTSLDAVYTGTPERSTSSRVKALFIAGAVSGTYPDDIKYEGFLSNSDREQLSEMGISFAPTTKNQMDMQYFKVYRALCAADEKLYFCYPVQNGEGAAYRPARIITDVSAMFPKAVRGDNLVYEPSDPENITSKAAALRSLLINCADPLKRLPPVWRNVYKFFESRREFENLRLIDEASVFGRRQIRISRESAKRLYDGRVPGRETGRLYSATNIDTYARCPMMYFIRYGIRAKADEEMEIGAAHVGTYAHMLIQTLCKRIEDGAESFEEKREKWLEWANKTPEDFEKDFSELISSIVAQTAKELEKIAPYDIEPRKRTLRRIGKTVASSAHNVYRSITEGKFVPLGYEQDFGICPLNDEVFIRGKIDRVDEGIRADGRKVFRVIDYKTGSTQFSLSDIRNGINMQLFIYALAAMKFYGEDMELTGVYYQPVHDKMRRLRIGEQKDIERLHSEDILLDGITFADKEDTELAELYSSSITEEGHSADAGYLKLRLVKKRDKFNSHTIHSTEERKSIFGKVEENIIGIDREIMDGNIKQRPYLGKNKQSACVYCDFRDICMFDMDGALSRMPDNDGARFGAEGKEDK
jgi:ATP-dependent helicase/nuclease subunit B